MSTTNITRPLFQKPTVERGGMVHHYVALQQYCVEVGIKSIGMLLSNKGTLVT